MNLADKLMNPRGQAIKKWASELLKDRYPKHDQFLERMSHAVVTDQDLQDFGKFAVDLFEVGYFKCMNDYKDSLKDLGINVTVVPERPK